MPIVKFSAISETLLTLRSRVRTRLQDPNKRLWSDNDLNQYINLGCVDLQQRTEWLEDWNLTDVKNAIKDYPRSSDIIQNMKWQVFDTSRIDVADIYMLDRFKPDWRQDSNNVPIRVYRSDWNQDSFAPTPNADGDALTFSSEYGVVVMIQDSVGNNVGTFSSELGENIQTYDSSNGDDFFQKRITFNDPASDSVGIWCRMQSPYGNLENTFNRYPDNLVNDSDLVPFPVWSHYALEEFCLSMCFAKEGDGQNLKLSEGHRRLYENLWVPFVLRMVNSRTPDHPLIWRGQDRGDQRPANRSTVTPSYAGI